MQTMTFSSTADFDLSERDWALTSKGDLDVFVAKLSDTPIISGENSIFVSEEYTIFPNPTDGCSRVQLPFTAHWRLEIRNSIGFLLHQSQFNTADVVVDLIS